VGVRLRLQAMKVLAALVLVMNAGLCLGAEPPPRFCGDNELWQAITIAACRTADSTDLDEPGLAKALKIPNRIEVKYANYNGRERELIVPAQACLGRLFGQWQPFMAIAVQHPKDVKPPILRFYLVKDGLLSAVALGNSATKTFTRLDPNADLENRLRAERGFWLRHFGLVDGEGKVRGCL